MSGTYSSKRLDLASCSPTTALCLSLSNSVSGLKRYAFDEGERIKKRRKQLNPVRLSVEPVGDSIPLTHITIQRQSNLSSTSPDFESSLSLKSEIEDNSPLDFSVNWPEVNDSLPLNLTKNRSSPKSKVRSEVKQLFSPSREDASWATIKSESAAIKPLISVVTEASISPASFPYLSSSTNAMHSAFTNSLARSSCRIFNPDAFCNICNKEFCNKYFLKTHKANKHGVYYEGKDTNGDLELPSVPLINGWNIKNNNIKVPTLNPYIFNTNTTTIKDSSAFCNICEKEFCNKYFLRRHKEKMHGIVTFSENRKTDQDSEKSEDDDKVSEELKLFFTDLNTYQSKVESDKYGRYCVTLSDAVTDPINNCSNNKLLKNTEGELLKKEKKELDNICEVVTEEFGVQAKEEDFTEIMQNNLEEKNGQICDYCKRSLSTAAIFKVHQKYVHAISPEDDDEFKHIENIYFMLLKFSWLNTTVTYCEICQTDFEKNDILEMHLMNKHGNLVDELSRIIEDAGVNGLSAPSLSVGDGTILCQICSKTFLSNAAFQQHVYEKCSYPEIPFDCYPSAEDIDSGSKSTRNFCQICKKELCNKYFMKTHMRRMHGIAIQTGVRIGGVMCEICNKELCSKYFLRVHKKNCHGVVEGALFCKIPAQEDKVNEVASQACIICRRVFKSIKWLKTHLVNDHGKIGAGMWQELETEETGKETLLPSVNTGCVEEEKHQLAQLYPCSKCQFQAVSTKVLMDHQRQHSETPDEILYRCMYCFIVTKDKISFDEHIALHHLASAEFQEGGKVPSRHHTACESALDAEAHLMYGISNTT